MFSEHFVFAIQTFTYYVDKKYEPSGIILKTKAICCCKIIPYEFKFYEIGLESNTKWLVKSFLFPPLFDLLKNF